MGRVTEKFWDAAKHTLLATTEGAEALVKPSKSKLMRDLSWEVVEYAPFIALGLTPHAILEILHEQAKKGDKSKVKDFLVNTLHSENIFGKGLGLKEKPGFPKRGDCDMSGKDRVNKYWKEAQLAEALLGGIGSGIAGIGLSELYWRIKDKFSRVSDREADKIVSELMKEDPVLSSANKDVLISAYKTFARLAPNLANDKNLVKTFLHSAVATGGNIDIGTAKALIDANASWRKGHAL